MQRRFPIVWKLLGVYLLPTVATFAGFGLLAHFVAVRALEAELGQRLTAVAGAVASQLSDEQVALLQPGDEETRTYKNVQKRLDEFRQSTGVERIYLFDSQLRSLGDTRKNVPLLEPYPHLIASRAETHTVFSEKRPSASVLFTVDGQRFKSGYAPFLEEDGKVGFAVGVDAAARQYEQLAALRRTLVTVGLGGALLVVLLSLLVARLLVRPLKKLESAAQIIADGNLAQPISVPSRDEVGFLAATMEGMRKGLAARDERMQMMLAGIAHEVRNPLGGMEIYCGLLRDDLTGDAEKLGHVHRIERELQHLKTVVGEFLEFARRPRAVLSPCNVGELLSQIRELTAAQAAARKVEVTCAIETNDKVLADDKQLRRALLNLLQNAIAACPEDGTGKVALVAQKIDDKVVLEVKDNGSGIAAETVDKIWTPFYTTKQSGTGLGLAFVRDIASEHGAQLTVESEPGQGTSFRFTLLSLAESS